MGDGFEDRPASGQVAEEQPLECKAAVVPVAVVPAAAAVDERPARRGVDVEHEVG